MDSHLKTVMNYSVLPSRRFERHNYSNAQNIKLNERSNFRKVKISHSKMNAQNEKSHKLAQSA